MDPDEPAEERVPWWRYAIAATLGLSILALTYVLFDPDLGTDAPLFGEFTCRGKLEVTIANGFDEPYLVPGGSAVHYRATREGNATLAVSVTLFVREKGEDWRAQLTRRDEPSDAYIYIPRVTENTEAYVEAKDVTGEICGGRSPVIGARAVSAPTPSPEPSSSP